MNTVFRIRIVPLVVLFLLLSTLPPRTEARAPLVRPSIELHSETVPQGGVLLVRVEAPPDRVAIRGRVMGRPFSLVRVPPRDTLEGLAGIDLEDPTGEAEVEVVLEDARGKKVRLHQRFTVVPGDFGVDRLKVSRKMVDFSPAIAERVRNDSRRLRELYALEEERLWSGHFIIPSKGRISSSFGRRRILNGKPRSPHTGVDIAAATGTPVAASGTGRVVLADELYLTGRTIVLEHGGGLKTVYCHLSKMEVEEGDLVQRGEVIGRVGTTGRVTGAHLHWATRLNGARVSSLALTKLPLSGPGLASE